MRWLEGKGEAKRRMKGAKPVSFTHFRVWQEDSPESRRFFCAVVE